MWEAERHGPEFQVGQVFAKMLRIVEAQVAKMA